MSERDWRLFVKDVAESCKKILDYTGGLSRDDFFSDPKTLDAVMRNLAIIGEAAKKIPVDVRKRYPRVEWKKMAGLRDIVIHDYFGINEDIIWDVVANKIPLLLQDIELIPK